MQYLIIFYNSCERATCYIVDETKGEIWSKVA